MGTERENGLAAPKGRALRCRRTKGAHALNILGKIVGQIYEKRSNKNKHILVGPVLKGFTYFPMSLLRIENCCFNISGNMIVLCENGWMEGRSPMNNLLIEQLMNSERSGMWNLCFSMDRWREEKIKGHTIWELLLLLPVDFNLLTNCLNPCT